MGALGLRGLLDLLPKTKAINLSAWAATGFASLLLVAAFGQSLFERMPYGKRKAGQAYMDMLPILEGYTEPGSLIGMTGGGNAGYFIKDRTIVNMDGLINSYQYFEAVKKGEGGKYLENIGLDYVFANYYIVTETMPYVEQFDPEDFVPVEAAPEYGRKELLKYVPKP